MEGNNLYFGSSNKTTVNIEPTKFSGKSLTISIPEEYDLLNNKIGKYSYHESGQFHYKEYFEGKTNKATQYNWQRPDNLKKPQLLLIVISKIPKFYELHNSTITKGQTHAIVYQINDDSSRSRHYFEFYASPEGTFNFPNPILFDKNIVNDNMGFCTLSSDITLVFRHLYLAEDNELNLYHPDVEICMTLENLNH